MREVPSWHTYNMNTAIQTAERSKDPKTQVGAYICDESNNPISRGYNGFPRGMTETAERWQRPHKYDLVVHAELNAVLNAMKCGRSVVGCTLYTTLHPCSKCALLLAASGILKVYYKEFRDEPEFQKAAKILSECGILTKKLEN